jgi:predicted lipoprotein with Yx(FWY)xxD motif
MKKIRYIITAAVILTFFAATAMAMHHAVKIAQKDDVGKYLADTEGKALYWFKKDSPGKSACTGACVDKWPLYYRETVAAPPGGSAGDFGTIQREDGKPQTTFRGYPLYYWAGDEKSGDTKGQNINNIWFVIDPGNFPVK